MCVFSFHPICYLRATSPSPSIFRYSDPGSHVRHSPPPTAVHAFMHIARKSFGTVFPRRITSNRAYTRLLVATRYLLQYLRVIFAQEKSPLAGLELTQSTSVVTRLKHYIQQYFTGSTGIMRVQSDSISPRYPRKLEITIFWRHFWPKIATTGMTAPKKSSFPIKGKFGVDSPE